MKTIHIKRFMNKNELPKAFGVYFTEEGELKFLETPKKFFTFDNMERNPQWWLEEVNLPTDEEIQKKLFFPEDESKDKCAIVGAIWMRDVIAGTWTRDMELSSTSVLKSSQ